MLDARHVVADESQSPNQTAYALGCHKNVTTSRCGFDPSITVTEGVSSFIMTESYALKSVCLSSILRI